MNKNSFFSDLLQNIGFISAIAVAISQYALSDNFRIFFGESESLFKAASLVALIVSIGLILGIFVMRFSLLNKMYLPFSGKSNYTKKMNEISQKKAQVLQEKGAEEAQKYQNSVEWPVEPHSIKAIHLGFVFLIFAVALFVLMVLQLAIWLTLFSFISFISLTVASISIFSIQMYRDGEYRKTREETDQVIYNKINEFFSDKVIVMSDFQDQNNFINPIRTIIVEHPTRGLFRVDCNAYDPGKSFSIQKVIPENN